MTLSKDQYINIKCILHSSNNPKMKLTNQEYMYSTEKPA